MSFHKSEQFAALRAELRSRFASTVAQFARDLSLSDYSPTSLLQMDRPVDEIVAEVLMFGCDAWPDYAQVDMENPANAGSSEYPNECLTAREKEEQIENAVVGSVGGRERFEDWIMSYHNSEEFTALQQELKSTILSAATQFARSRGLTCLSEDGLGQMSTSLTDVSGDILMFGCDIWPDTARVEEAAEMLAPFEVAPSEADPPTKTRGLFYTIIALAIPALLAFIRPSPAEFTIGLLSLALALYVPWMARLSGLRMNALGMGLRAGRST